MGQATYQGGLFDRQLPKGKVSGQIDVLDNGIHFSGSDGKTTLLLPLDQLEIKRGGTNNRLLFLTHPSKPGVAVHTADKSLLKEPILLGTPATRSQVQSIQGNRRTGMAIAGTIILLVLGSFAGLFLAKGTIAHSIAKKLPPDIEEKLGESAYSQISLGAKRIHDPEIQEQLHQLLAPLMAAIPEDRYEFQFHIFDNKELNAFAMPGGFVVIHSGLLLEVDQPEEILGVLAHEIAHVTEQHSVRNIIESTGLLLVVQTFFGDMTGLAAIMTDGGAQLLQKSFSRTFEEDADDVGLQFLANANINPEGLIGLLQLLMEEQNKTIYGKAMDKMAWLSTHPTTDDRIQTLRKKISQLPPKEYAPVDFDLAKFQENLRNHVGKGIDE